MAKFPLHLCLALCLIPALLQGQGGTSYKVVRVIDGDTLLLSHGERVRLVGVDTPEVHVSKKLRADARRSELDETTIRELGRNASRFVKNMVENREVTLEYDPHNAPRRHRDRYGRVLAYVYFNPRKFDTLPSWLEEDVYSSRAYQQGLLNAVIVFAGYGQAYTKYPFERMDEFRGYDRAAREANRGLWR